MDNIETLIKRAETAEGLGDLIQANTFWNAIKENAPRHPRILVRDAMSHLNNGNIEIAFNMLLDARNQAPNEPSIPLHLGLIFKLRGNLSGAIEQFDAALSIDPYLFLGLLWKGAALEQAGDTIGAAATYANALKTAPPKDKIAPQLAAAIDHAKKCISNNAVKKRDYLYSKTMEIRKKYSTKELLRAEECLEIISGTKKHYVHEGIMFNFPQLPAIQFYDREYFPWLEELEAATPFIQEEAQRIIKHNWEKFAPYVQTPKDKPTNQWEYLNFNPEWSTIHFWRDGKRFDDVHELCPKTS